MRRILYSILLALVMLLTANNQTIKAQSGCEEILEQARELFSQGLINQIPEMLALCMEEGFTRNQKMEAYKLLILSYLFDDNQFAAEETMVEFLKRYPEYQIMPGDPFEFRYLFESYRTTSVFSVGLLAGYNITDPRIIEPYSLLDATKSASTDKIKSGFQFSLGAAWYLSTHTLLNLELAYLHNQFSFQDEINLPLPDGTSSINFVSYTEKMNRIEIPLSLSYEFNIGTINYFLRSGVSFAAIVSSKGQASRKYAPDVPPVTSPSTIMKDQRKGFSYGIIVGGGLRYKVPRGVIAIDLRANIGVNNIVKKEERYRNQVLTSKYYYLDDDFSLTSISLTTGYYFSFYTPSKQR